MPIEIHYAARSDVGRERSENQDAYGDKHLEDLDFFVVCDGMGGHAGGSTASRLAVVTVEEQLEALDLAPPARMRSALERANAVVFGKAQRNRELRGMGTTAVVLTVDRHTARAWTAHVGDSRIYRVRGGTVLQLTRDHTMVQRLVDDGILTEAAAEHHPNANVISRSLGGREQVDVELGLEPLELAAGDIFVLCSDGLHGLVPEAEIARVVTSCPPDAAARRLIEHANEAGGHDNITVTVVRFGDAPPPREGPWEIVRPPRPSLQAEVASMKDDGPDATSPLSPAPSQAADPDVVDDVVADASPAPAPADAPADAAAEDAATAPMSRGKLARQAPAGRATRQGRILVIAIVVAVVLVAALLGWMLISTGAAVDTRSGGGGGSGYRPG